MRPTELAGRLFEEGRFEAGIAELGGVPWKLIEHDHQVFFGAQAGPDELARLVYDTSVCAFRDRVAGYNNSRVVIELYANLNAHLASLDITHYPNLLALQCIILANLGDEYRRINDGSFWAAEQFERALFIAESTQLHTSVAVIGLMHALLNLASDPALTVGKEDLLTATQKILSSRQQLGTYVPRLISTIYLFVHADDARKVNQLGTKNIQLDMDFFNALTDATGPAELSGLWRGVFVPFFSHPGKD